VCRETIFVTFITQKGIIIKRTYRTRRRPKKMKRPGVTHITLNIRRVALTFQGIYVILAVLDS